MIISFKKLVCVFLLIICGILFFISTFSAYNSLLVVAEANENSFTVVLDAGHGGEDGGAVAVDGTAEKDINLSIAMKLKSIFEQNGINAITTRESDVSIGDNSLETLKQRKTSDMKKRLEIFNNENVGAVISIHQNKFEQSKYNGTQIFYSANNPLSLSLAENIKNSVVSSLQPDNTRECKAANKSIYLLYNAQNPTVIVECGFISNSVELEKLKSNEYQSKLALAIFDGFMKYYSENSN